MSRVDLESEDWNKVCEIIEKLESIGDTSILGDCIRVACSNSEEAMNCVIGNYLRVLYDE